MVFIGMKRERDSDINTITNTANFLMLLANGGQPDLDSSARNPSRVYECKTCQRQFPSFQALGGHRASHKKPKVIGGDSDQHQLQSSPPKPKTHECSICGVEFAIGQALGGHMRRHRAAMMKENKEEVLPVLSLSSSPPRAVPVLKKSNSSKRVLCLDLNLSLFPMEYGLAFDKDENVASTPVFRCYL